MNDWTFIASVVLGYITQLVKAHKNIPTSLAQVVAFAIAFGFYAAGHHDTPLADVWFRDGVAWALAVLGWSSVAGASKLAPKTDSIGG